MICACGYSWEHRVKEPRKCPICQRYLIRIREPRPAGLEQVESYFR